MLVEEGFLQLMLFIFNAEEAPKRFIDMTTFLGFFCPSSVPLFLMLWFRDLNKEVILIDCKGANSVV